MTIASLMIEPAPHVDETAPFDEAIRMLPAQPRAELPVLSRDGRFLGVLPGRRVLELARSRTPKKPSVRPDAHKPSSKPAKVVHHGTIRASVC